MAEKQHTSRYASLKEKMTCRNVVAVVLVACLVLLVMLAGTALGKYQHQFEPDTSVKAKDFYFTSDFLDGGTHTLAPGSTSVTFTLKNHADELRYSEVPISYTVTVTPDAGADEPTVANSTGTLPVKSTSESAQQDSDQEVTISGLGQGTYTVTAIGIGGGSADGSDGYQKTLTAKIEVLPAEPELYQYQKNVRNEYVLLTVWNEGDAEGKVDITYTGIPDNTNPNMQDWVTGDQGSSLVTQGSITIGPHESKVFRFFNGENINAKLSGINDPVASGTPK